MCPNSAGHPAHKKGPSTRWLAWRTVIAGTGRPVESRPSLYLILYWLFNSGVRVPLGGDVTA